MDASTFGSNGQLQILSDTQLVLARSLQENITIVNQYQINSCIESHLGVTLGRSEAVLAIEVVPAGPLGITEGEVSILSHLCNVLECLSCLVEGQFCSAIPALRSTSTHNEELVDSDRLRIRSNLTSDGHLQILRDADLVSTSLHNERTVHLLQIHRLVERDFHVTLAQSQTVVGIEDIPCTLGSSLLSSELLVGKCEVCSSSGSIVKLVGLSLEVVLQLGHVGEVPILRTTDDVELRNSDKGCTDSYVGSRHDEAVVLLEDNLGSTHLNSDALQLIALIRCYSQLDGLVGSTPALAGSYGTVLDSLVNIDSIAGGYTSNSPARVTDSGQLSNARILEDAHVEVASLDVLEGHDGIDAVLHVLCRLGSGLLNDVVVEVEQVGVCIVVLGSAVGTGVQTLDELTALTTVHDDVVLHHVQHVSLAVLAQRRNGLTAGNAVERRVGDGRSGLEALGSHVNTHLVNALAAL